MSNCSVLWHQSMLSLRGEARRRVGILLQGEGNIAMLSPQGRDVLTYRVGG